MIHMESWDGRMLGCQNYQPAMRNATPNIDALAARGTRFANTYCTNPICCPSRANMLSGTYTHVCESWNNFKGLETGMWTYSDALRRSGYDVELLGKHGDYLTGHHSVMNRVADMLEPLNIRQLQVMNEDEAQGIEVKPTRERRCHANDWAMFDKAGEFLRRRGNGSDGTQPFFLCLNPGLVHAAFVTNDYWLDQIPEDLVDVPRLDNTDHPAEIYQRRAKGWRHGSDDDTVRKVRRIYFAMCAEADAMVGELLQTLRSSGLDRQTTVIFAGDHGELAMEHQQYYKMSHFEGSARVPLILAGPGIRAGQVIDTPVSLIDIAPTICELGGLPRRPNFNGESLLPTAQGQASPRRGWALATYSGITQNTMSHMIRRGDHKLIAYEGHPSRLFNVVIDPQELDDLAATEPDIVRELTALLDEQIDRKQTVATWNEYRRHAFGQFQRQAKRGLYWDNSYGLRGNPSSDYETLMENTFTGWTAEDEARVSAWLAGDESGTSSA